MNVRLVGAKAAEGMQRLTGRMMLMNLMMRQRRRGSLIVKAVAGNGNDLSKSKLQLTYLPIDHGPSAMWYDATCVQSWLEVVPVYWCDFRNLVIPARLTLCLPVVNACALFGLDSEQPERNSIGPLAIPL